MNRIIKLIPSWILVFLIMNPALSQTNVNLSPFKDNSIFQESGSKSNGKGSYLFAGKTNGNNARRALIAFDIAGSIPTGATIASVTLKMNMSQSATGAQTINLHRIISDWGEGTSNASGQEGKGAQASTNDATWSHAFFNTTQWTSPGGDFSSTSSASQTISGNGSYTWGASSKMVADVQNWLDNPSTNFGWILIGNESAVKTTKRFDSRENSSEANRPLLSITYNTSTNVEIINSIPNELVLTQNYPNPFNPDTQIRFNLSNAGFVNLEVFNVRGQKIKTIVSRQFSAGSFSVDWDGTDDFGEAVRSGVYVYRIQTEQFQDSKRMILMK